MKKGLLLLLTFSLAFLYSNAQSKVFKEVSEEISSLVAPITQDDALVGYLVFARLEKASEDSFNYRVTIMDENLNDIGTVNFKEENIFLQGVAFEQDVLCLAYFKSRVYGKAFSSSKVFKAEKPGFKNYVMLQFLGLNGKILKTNSLPVNIKLEDFPTGKRREVKAFGKLKNDIQLINVPQHGFACFYGDEDKKQLSVFKSNGERLWQKPINEEPTGLSLLASGNDLYMVTNLKDAEDKYSFEIHSFGVQDSVVYPKYTLKDKNGHGLALLTFANNPATGKPYVSGYVRSSRKSTYGGAPKGIVKGYYAGIYTCSFNGHDKKDIKEVFSYWDDNSNPSISAKGYYRDEKVYADLNTSFRDYAGNTYFVGNSFVKRPRWGAIVSSIITAPLITPPIFILALGGTSKARLDNPILLKQDVKGILTYETPVESKKGSFRRAAFPLSLSGYRTFTTVMNPNTKNHYLIVDDGANSSIYNVNNKKVVRKVPAKDGNVTTKIFPAKEGHIMVAEYNKKEKYTRVSIEAL